jgi:chaperonin GroEL
MVKEVYFGNESRKKTLVGVQGITNAVRVTMGGSGKCVLIGDGVYGANGMMVQLDTIVSKDGWTVAKHFELSDPVENRGAMMIKEAATKTVEQVGDATTCTCVLAESLITNGMELIDEGANSQLLKKGMDAALLYVVDELKKISTPVRGNIDRVRQIATVSANNDNVIGNLIADAVSKIGYDGVIDVEEGSGLNTEIKITDGYKISRGWESPLFITDRAKEVCEFENPLILLYEKKITHHTQIERAISISNSQQRPLVIICEAAEEEGLAFLAINNQRGNVRCCAIKAPEFGNLRREGMEDIALITGASYISDIKGIDIKEVNLSHFGQAKKIIISKNETVIIGGDKGEEFNDFIADLQMNLTQAKTEDDKFPIEKRIARLSGNVALIQVGAATETELREKLDRVDDAVRATKAAIEEGFVAGGGIAFLNLSIGEFLENNVNENVDFKKGISLVDTATIAPLIQICKNAGLDGYEIKNILCENPNTGKGYDVLTGEIIDMEKAGIIDSTKALRCALTNAVSVAGMVLTSECSIITVH